MSKAIVTLAIDSTVALPAGSDPYASTLVTLTDSAGAVQTASVNGTETPAWTVEFDDITATGTGTIVAQLQTAAGAAILAPVPVPLPAAGVVTPPSTVPSVTGITVTVS
jgi:hypothetical protein